MKGLPPTGTVPRPSEEVFYPCSDGEPVAETEVHLLVMLNVIVTLRQFFEAQPRVYAIGNMFLYYEEGNPEARKAPDVMVIKDVEPRPHRDFFKIWEEGATPAVIFEITSPSTAQEDLEAKKQLYEQLGVREYFLFDPKNEYLEQQLMGYRLINRVYEPLPPAKDGGIVSAELMLVLKPDGSELALHSFRTGERLLTPPETHRHYVQARREIARLDQLLEAADKERQELKAQLKERDQEVEKERLRADNERLRADNERLRADNERLRADKLAAELARLQTGQTPPQAPNSPPGTP
jgi:Uma2 family endonuclease